VNLPKTGRHSLTDAKSRKQKAPSQWGLADGGFVSVAEGAAFLAISRTRMYELPRANIISSARLGGKLCIPRLALLEYAAARIQLGSIA